MQKLAIGLVLGSGFSLLAASCGGVEEQAPARLGELGRMAFVPAGRAELGQLPGAFPVAADVGLLVDRFEARWSDFEAWTGAGDLPQGAEFPATCSWHEAVRFAERRGMRLPTVSEWVYIATGGQGTGQDWPLRQRDSVANTLELGLFRSLPVGAFEAGRGPYGTYDQIGNVWEWTADHATGLGISLGDEAGLDMGSEVGMRTVMGGSYMTRIRPLLAVGGVLPVFGRSLGPDHRAPDIGLRCVADARSWLREHAAEIGIRNAGDRQRLVEIGARWYETGGGQAVQLLEELVESLALDSGLETVELLLKGARP